jgi:hypothetical protein
LEVIERDNVLGLEQLKEYFRGSSDHGDTVCLM